MYHKTLFALALSTAGLLAAKPEAAVTLAFDQAWSYANSCALPGVVYVSTGWVGKPGFLTWEQLQQLQRRGWEIGSSTVNHALATEFSPSELEYELEQGKLDLAAHGIQAVSFASSFGDYNYRTLAAIARKFQSNQSMGHPKPSLSTRKQDQPDATRFAKLAPSPETLNYFPYNRYLLAVQEVKAATTAAEVGRWLSEARASNGWLILLFRDRSMPKAGFAAIAAKVKESNLPVVTVKARLDAAGPNLLANGDFRGGLQTGWTASPSAQVIADTNSNGAWPEPVHSIALTGGATAVEVRSPEVAVKAGAVYGIHTFVNNDGLKSGALAFAVEETDASGHRTTASLQNTSGSASGVFDAAFVYRAKSLAKSARLVIRLSAGAIGRVYLDQVSWPGAL